MDFLPNIDHTTSAVQTGAPPTIFEHVYDQQVKPGQSSKYDFYNWHQSVLSGYHCLSCHERLMQYQNEIFIFETQIEFCYRCPTNPTIYMPPTQIYHGQRMGTDKIE